MDGETRQPKRAERAKTVPEVAKHNQFLNHKKRFSRESEPQDLEWIHGRLRLAQKSRLPSHHAVVAQQSRRRGDVGK